MAFKDQRTTFIHQAIHEFVVTRIPSQTGIYPLLSLLTLLIQKPLLLVVFTKPLHKIDAEQGKNCGWAHCLRFPDELKAKFDIDIAQYLHEFKTTTSSDPLKNHPWIFDPLSNLSETERSDLKQVEHIHAIGVFYLNIVNGHRQFKKVDHEIDKAAGLGMTAETAIEYLCSSDQNKIKNLFDSIVNHTFQKRRPHWHDVVSFSNHAIKNSSSLFSPPRSNRKRPIQNSSPPLAHNITSHEMVRMLTPIVEEIDKIYRDLRGGEAEILHSDFNPTEESGTKLIWSRYRTARRKGQGIRPPTIAFYMQVRCPRKSFNDIPNKAGYRIVPIVTRTIASDLAFTISENLKKATKNEPVIKYLCELGIQQPNVELLSDVEKLSDAIYNASSIETYLTQQYYHSFTFAAFSNGFASFTSALPASRCDHVAHGPQFLAEDKRDTAFTKVTTISGFPFIAIVTKSLAKIGHDDKPFFDAFYHNVQFHLGITRRWVSRRLRSSVQKVYTDKMHEAIISSLASSDVVILRHESSQTEKVYLPEDWCWQLNHRLDQITQAIPYARIRVSEIEGTRHPSHAITVSVKNHSIFVWTEPNPYFDGYLIEHYETYMKSHKVKLCFNQALQMVEKIWSEMPRTIVDDNGQIQEQQVH